MRTPSIRINLSALDKPQWSIFLQLNLDFGLPQSLLSGIPLLLRSKNSSLIWTCGFPYSSVRLYAGKIDIPVLDTKLVTSLDFCRGHLTARKLVPLLRHVTNCEQPMWSLLCAGSFFEFFPFSHVEFFRAFIRIWGNCPCLFYMLTNTTLNRLGFGNSSVLIAFVDKFQSRQ